MDYSVRDLTLHLTEECNLDCRYCFQKRRSQRLGFSTIRKVLESFQDAFEARSFIGFYGGEPLLEFDTIRRTVEYIQAHKTLRRKKLRYSVSTNGTLLNKEVLGFLNTHKFRVNLSHDGTAQETTRPSRMNSLMLENLDRLVRLRGIELDTNSVFVPVTVGEIYRSARFLLERGIQNCNLSYSLINPWESKRLDQMRGEVQELRAFLLSHYRRHRTIPVVNFRSRPSLGLFWCSAGQDRLALAADGKLWGSRFFADFFADKSGHPEFNNYCFGDIQEFADRPQNGYCPTYRNYGLLRQEAFSSEEKACRKCTRLLYCSVCPATAALSTGRVGIIPAWICDIKNIWLEEVRKFWEAAGKN